jgi:hypothetical protein
MFLVDNEFKYFQVLGPALLLALVAVVKTFFPASMLSARGTLVVSVART